MRFAHAFGVAVGIAFALSLHANAHDQVVTDSGDNGGANQLRANLAAVEGPS